ncbi:hypothetical protein VYU27_006385 [Nannochloropsis oceanica]
MPPRLKSRPSPALHPSSSVVISLIFLYFVLSVDAFQFLQPLPYSRRFLHRNLHLHRHLKAARTALPPSVVVPEHLALVLDGNGRWAQQRGLPRGAGHMEGTQRAFDVLKTCQALGIRTVTLYCLSTENWSRPQAEIIIILGCIENSLRANLEYAHKNRIRLVVIGQMHRLPLSLQALVTRAEAETAGYTQEDGMTVCLALSYGGRDDIVQACRALAKQVATGEVHPEEIDETLFESRLSTHQKGILRPPDLVVRTSGEQRWSNFMLFECAYSEFFVSEALWPDFRQENLLAALESYGRRRRRFGRVTECQPAAAATTEQQGGKADHGRV